MTSAGELKIGALRDAPGPIVNRGVCGGIENLSLGFQQASKVKKTTTTDEKLLLLQNAKRCHSPAGQRGMKAPDAVAVSDDNLPSITAGHGMVLSLCRGCGNGNLNHRNRTRRELRWSGGLHYAVGSRRQTRSRTPYRWLNGSRESILLHRPASD
ncbi:hypothetical protein ZHAS_00020034 [Anopheles sinensis]|uniref:Uncharacterized protein n=1 Tax=Anopheles sinensis TaxID=74873 RepID=A0A084WNS6_ANOSI|nr:hypothetical protein ZHAS_00020034 [Anopheles sinensis]